MRFSTAEVAAITGGRQHGPDVTFDGATLDSRGDCSGRLFVPIVAERDGHEFIAAALEAGAAAHLSTGPVTETSAVVVDDTEQALRRLGQAARERFDGPVVGITGSVGKTTVKDLAIAAVSAGRVCHGSEKSHNNELGVPLTLINTPGEAEVLIVEMGARGVGHITYLCEIAQPTVGVVTWVGAAHTSEFGSIEAVAAAKAELVQALADDATAILNADCALVADMAAATAASIVSYGQAGQWRAQDVTFDDSLRPRFVAHSPHDAAPVELSVAGEHQVSNSLAALAIAHTVGVDLGTAAGGLARADLSPWRMETHRSPAGGWIINDAYNANAISTAVALRSLARLPAARHVAVLGLMAELGHRHDADHQAMASLAADLGIELIAYQEPGYGVAPVDTFEQVIDQLGIVGDDTAVLVKGSRVAQLERLADKLLQPNK